MIDLQIPFEVPSQNVRERWHWSKRKREVDRWSQWFKYELRLRALSQSDREQWGYDFAKAIGLAIAIPETKEDKP